MDPELIEITEIDKMGRSAFERATQYAKDREVFGRPIGLSQSVQHPLAETGVELEVAYMLIMSSASRYDNGRDCGAKASGSK